MIEIWMKNYLVSDNNCNTYQVITTLALVTLYRGVQLMLRSTVERVL
jgi:hypothetical protein